MLQYLTIKSASILILILMKTCLLPVLSTPSLLQVQSPDRTSRLHSVIIIVKSLIIHVEVEVEPEGAVGGGLVTVGSLHPVSTELQTWFDQHCWHCERLK